MAVELELSPPVELKQVALVGLGLHLVGIVLSILKIAVMNVVIVATMPEIVLASAGEVAGMF